MRPFEPYLVRAPWGEAMNVRERLKASGCSQWDWRGWIALAWALWWGWAYAVMVWQARGQQLLAWIGWLKSGL
jgi:hypothetical protein